MKKSLQNIKENFSLKYLISNTQGRLLIFLPILIFIAYDKGKDIESWHFMLLALVFIWNIWELSSSKSTKD